MDLSLPAPKLLVSELQKAVKGSGIGVLGKLKFERVWLQGKIVSPLEHGTLTLDDGSGLIDLFLRTEDQVQLWEPGMYVLVIGRIDKDPAPFIEVHKILDLTSQTHREAAWHLEVAEAHEKFYDQLIRTDQTEH